MGNRLERDALEGKGAVVTGANSGIGACITQKLLAYGMTVIGIDTETDNLDVSQRPNILIAIYTT